MNSKRHAAQLRNSYKSPWRNLPGAKDKGQRFEVHYKDGDGKDHIFGWSDTLDGARGFVEAVNLHPVWHTARIFDREGKEWAE